MSECAPRDLDAVAKEALRSAMHACRRAEDLVERQQAYVRTAGWAVVVSLFALLFSGVAVVVALYSTHPSGSPS